MLDIKLVRENPGVIRKDLKKRGDPGKLKILNTLIKNDKEWRSGLKRLEDMRRKRNLLTDEIAKLKNKGKNKDAEKRIKQLRTLPKDIKALEERVQELQSLNRDALMRLPNILHETVPKGKDEHDNVPVKHWGKVPKFGFKPRNHLEVAQGLGLIDGERAARIAGSGFFYLRGDLARLDYAIMNLAMDLLVKRGFTPIMPPFMMGRKPYEGVVSLDDFEKFGLLAQLLPVIIVGIELDF